MICLMAEPGDETEDRQMLDEMSGLAGGSEELVPAARTPTSVRLLLAGGVVLALSVGLFTWSVVDPNSGGSYTNAYALLCMACMAAVVATFLIIIGFTFVSTERRSRAAHNGGRRS
jgi:hypothetical protein